MHGQPLRNTAFLPPPIEAGVSCLSVDEISGINRQLYRIQRLAGNMIALDKLNRNDYIKAFCFMDFNAWVKKPMEEAQDLCASMNRTFRYKLCSEYTHIRGDRELLERMFYNLLSNAIKFGDPNEVVSCWTDRSATHLFFHMQNICLDTEKEFLRNAFTRFAANDVLPDPRFGLGMGLPLVQAIARLHGGMAAAEVRDKTATVTIAIPLSHNNGKIPLNQVPKVEYSGGIHRSILELSDVLPNQTFHPDAL